MHYEIRHGYKTGKPLTPAQRASGTFAEEPIVLGKVFRRGMKPMMLTEMQFNQHKAPLLRLLLSGSIEIIVVDEKNAQSRLDYKTARGLTAPEEPVTIPSAGDGPPVAPASEPVKREEPEASQPPSSATVGEDPAPPAPEKLPEAPAAPVAEVPEAPPAAPETVAPQAQKKVKRG